MATTGWQRNLGTSKQEQGILTPPPPRKHPCGCWFRGKDLLQMCQPHQAGLSNIMKQLQDFAKSQPTPQQPDSDAIKTLEEQVAQNQATGGIPWKEHVATAENVQIGITTPNDGNHNP